MLPATLAAVVFGPGGAARPDGGHALHALGIVHLAEERIGAGLREPHRARVPDLGHVRGWHLQASNRLSPGGAWPDPTGWVWPPAILNVTVPPGSICDLGWLPLVGGGAVDLLAALGLAEAAPLRSGRPVVRGEAVASPAGVSCLEVEVDGLYGLASDDLCVCVSPFSVRGVRPRGCGRPRTWQMTGLRA